MAYEPLHHKYRPQSFDQLVGQDAIAHTLSNALGQCRIAPAYLFCGPRGTGKTSSARILAKSLNCLSSSHPTATPCGTCEVCRGINQGVTLDIVEIDAASNTGVDNIRELIERAQFAPVQCRYKVYVIDECHMLSTAAFNALLKTLEEPPSHVIFVLATTDPQRVLPTIISRCQRFDFRRIPLEAMVNHLSTIADCEGIAITPEAVRLVAQIAQGGLRDAESLLDQLSLLDPPVNPEMVWDLVGAVPEQDLLALVSAIAQHDTIALLDIARRLMDRGREPLIVLQNLAGFYRDLLIAKTARDRPDLVAVTPGTWAAMADLAASLPLDRLLADQHHLRSAEVQLKNTTQPRLWLEITLLELLRSTSAAATSPVNRPTPPASPSPLSPQPRVTPDPVIPQPSPSPPPISPAAPANFMEQSSSGEPTQTPLPTPVAPAATPPPSPTVPPLGPDLAQAWGQALAQLPLSSRALIQQQGQLLSFDGHVARIGIKTQPLLKMAQARVPSLEAAFSEAFQRPIKVTVEVAPSTDSPVATPSPHPSPPTTSESTPAYGYACPPVHSPASLSVPRPPAEPSPPSVWEPESDIRQVAKRLADFFNGQIVDIADEDFPLPSPPGSSLPTSPPSPDTSVPF